MLCLPETKNKPLKDHIITVPDPEDLPEGGSPEEIPLRDTPSWLIFQLLKPWKDVFDFSFSSLVGYNLLFVCVCVCLLVYLLFQYK